MPSAIEKTRELYKKINSTQDSEQKLAIFRKVHNALRREPGSIRTLLSQLFPIGSLLDGNCKVALCRMIEEIVGRGLVPEDARSEVLSMCIEEFCRMIKEDDIYVQKRIMRSYAALYPQTLLNLYKNSDIELWKKACELKLEILSFLQHENAGLLEYVIRFMHCVILIQLKREASSPIFASDKLCLDDCPTEHAFLHHEELEMETTLLFQEYLKMLTSPKINIGPLTAIINCLISLCIMRPQLQIIVAKPLLESTQRMPPNLNEMGKQSYIRCIRNFFVAVYRTSTQSPTSKIYKEAAIALGYKPLELERLSKLNKHANISKKTAQSDGLYNNTQEETTDEATDYVAQENVVDSSLNPNSLILEQVVDIIINVISNATEAQWGRVLGSLSSTNDPKSHHASASPSDDAIPPPSEFSAFDVNTDAHALSTITSNGIVDIAPDEIDIMSETPEIDEGVMFIELLKNIINAEDYYSGGYVSTLAQEFDPNIPENYDKRKTLSAMKLGRYLLLSKLSVAPISFIEKDVLFDGEKTTGYLMKVYEMLVSYFMEDLKFSFEFMIIWLNHLWISEKRMIHKHNATKQDNIPGGYFYWVNYILDCFSTKLPPNDKFITKFFIEIPKLSESIIDRIAKEYCEDKNRIETGLFVLQALSNLRPAVRNISLSRLLKYTRHDDKNIRIPAILKCKRLYVANTEIASEIERYALKSVYKLLNEHPAHEKTAHFPTSSPNPNNEDNLGHENTENTSSKQHISPQEQNQIRNKAVAHTELYLVLCSIKQELSAECDFSPEVQKGIAIALDPLIKSLSSRPGRLMDLVKNFPGDPNFIAELARTAIESKERSALG